MNIGIIDEKDISYGSGSDYYEGVSANPKKLGSKQPTHGGTKDPLFIIEKGVMQEDSEEFVAFKREHIQVWGTISLIIS